MRLPLNCSNENDVSIGMLVSYDRKKVMLHFEVIHKTFCSFQKAFFLVHPTSNFSHVSCNITLHEICTQQVWNYSSLLYLEIIWFSFRQVQQKIKIIKKFDKIIDVFIKERASGKQEAQCFLQIETNTCYLSRHELSSTRLLLFILIIIRSKKLLFISIIIKISFHLFRSVVSLNQRVVLRKKQRIVFYDR